MKKETSGDFRQERGEWCQIHTPRHRGRGSRGCHVSPRCHGEMMDSVGFLWVAAATTVLAASCHCHSPGTYEWPPIYNINLSERRTVAPMLYASVWSNGHMV